MTELVLKDAFSRLSKRDPKSNKGNYGTLLSIVGSSYYRGAAQLCSLGALRTGVGILRVCSIEKVINPLCAAIPEAVFLPQKEGEYGEITGFDTASYFTEFPKTTALLMGCGLTTRGQIPELVEDVLKNSVCPLILDADALNVLSRDPGMLELSSKEIIITPHLGEFSRLTGKSIEEIKKAPEEHSKSFAEKYGITVILKDHNTIIATSQKLYISKYGNAGLARGGSGDVLAGMVASFVAQGLSMEDAAICGVLLQGASADRCAKRMSMLAMLPHDILTDLFEIFKEEGR